MGEVYRARDTRLDRTVAVKVLRGEVSADPERRARFDREARAVSSLTHPHVCALYDVGHQDGVDFLVMEYVEGDTLAARLAQGPLPLDQALRAGAQIAQALDAAHRQGIVHRDLKPGNVMLTRVGVKLLDFGLAKLHDTSQAAAGLTQLSTQERPLTAEGVVMGTVPYMAPEQVEGKPLDARSDIFSLGAVLYEMATGQRAFTGASQASLMAAILQHDPQPVSVLRPLSPPALDRIVAKCLAKDPDARWQSARDLAGELAWIAETGSAAHRASAAARRPGRLRAWQAATAVLLLAAVGSGAWALRREPPVLRPLRLALAMPAGAPYVHFDEAALSPDGRLLAFSGWQAPLQGRLWVRDLESGEVRPLNGTEQGRFPFWSPDGRFVAYFADGKLRKVDVAGGPSQVICDAPEAQGGAWSPSGVIVFAPRQLDVLHRVPATGGTSTPLTRLEPREEAHRWPSFLPDGKHFIFLGDAGRTEDHFLRIGSLDTGEARDLFQAVTNAIVTSSGHLVYVRGGSILAQEFDLSALRPTGEPVAIAEGATQNADNHRFEFTAAANGVLAYRTVRHEVQLAWYDRSGQRLAAVGDEARIGDFDLSPDGTRVAFERLDADRRVEDIWILDLARGVVSRLTSDRTGNSSPRWSPDGQRIAFTHFPDSHPTLVSVTAAAPGDRRVLSTTDAKEPRFPSGWTADGRDVLAQRYGDRKGDVLLLAADGRGEARELVATEFDDGAGRASPDGRWLAYDSDESGRMQIYVQPFTGTTALRRQVSTNGGARPRWRADGREVYFVDYSVDAVMAVGVGGGPGGAPEVGPPRELFRVPGLNGYAAAADGRRFLLSVQRETATGAPLTVMVNWTAALRR